MDKVLSVSMYDEYITRNHRKIGRKYFEKLIFYFRRSIWLLRLRFIVQIITTYKSYRTVYQIKILFSYETRKYCYDE